MAKEAFWKNLSQANQLIKEVKLLKEKTKAWQQLSQELKEISEMLSIVSEKDDILKEISQKLDEIEKKIKPFKLKSILSEEFDKYNAILSINAGAGGTEACDWAGMLLRMYSRWAEKRGFKIRFLDLLEGEEAGVKNVTLLIEGDYAYGFLKGESGVHRLVRISPFDANRRRHTSFASVDVIPELKEDEEVKINDTDLKIETFRASGPGGQHVNVTDSAVRITHLPTGIVVQCQNERSQYQNKMTALKVLKARLYELKRKEKLSHLEKLSGEKQKIEWGSQIRSYIMHPYNLVKDHRTGYETSNIVSVMDGEIDALLEAYLLKRLKDDKSY